MENKIRVGVLFGGRSAEHEVSLVSASSIIDALDRKKYDVFPIGITPEGRWLSLEGRNNTIEGKIPRRKSSRAPHPARPAQTRACGNQ